MTSFAGYKDYGSISPDGSRIAFSWTGGAEGSGGNPKRDIYIKPIGAGEPVQLTSTPEDDVFPAWSPDGRSPKLTAHVNFDPAAVANSGSLPRHARRHQGLNRLTVADRLASCAAVN